MAEVEAGASWVQKMRRLLEANPSFGVGEIGIDKIRAKEVPMEIQMKVFKRQLELAAEFGRPVSLHCVRAYGQLLDTLKEIDERIPAIVLHATQRVPLEFNSTSKKLKEVASSAARRRANLDQQVVGAAAQWPSSDGLGLGTDKTRESHAVVDSGVYFSVSARSPSPKHLPDILKAVPRDRLLIETDSPDQMPLDVERAKLEPVSEGINDSGLIDVVLKRVAEALGQDCDEVAAFTSENAERVFGVLSSP